jgi:hypothetical protein
MHPYGCEPNIVTYNTQLKNLCSAETWKDAEELMSKVTWTDFFLDMIVTLSKLMSFLYKKGCTPNFIDCAIQ